MTSTEPMYMSIKLSCFASILFCIVHVNGFAQCSINSSHGWMATFEFIPTSAIPVQGNCPWFYHYEVGFDYTVTFTGSPSNRSISSNIYFTCTGGTGGSPYRSMGTFTGNASGSSQTTNKTRQYNALGPAFNYGDNPSCDEVTLADINCNIVQITYWGSGVTGGSIICPTGTPLPVELNSFTAIPTKDFMELTWTTATETNNAYFLVQRSRDGQYWEDITRVEGAGTSDVPHTYFSTDENPLPGTSYYRLKQTDFNGSFEYSQVEQVEYGTNPNFRIYPNPATDKLYILTEGKPVNIRLLSSFGTPVPIIPEISAAGVELSLEHLPKGLYYLEIQQPTTVVLEKIMVL